jgi:hypothetical protein
MRKVAVLVVVAATVLVGAVVAFGQQTNKYTVTGSVSPTKKGSKAKPQPVKVKFAYQVSEATGKPPAAVKTYKIDVYGVRSNSRVAPTCASSKFSSGSDATCPAGARIGSGQVQSVVYQTSNPQSQGAIQCTKQLRVYNSGPNKAVLYLFGPGSQCGGVGQSFVIPAKYVRGSGGGTALTFTVPPNVLHPVAGLTVSVISTQSTIQITTKKIKGVRHGYYESIACQGSRRPIKVTFTTEAGQVSSASSSSPCSAK